MRRDQQPLMTARIRGLQVQLLGKPRLELDGQPLTRLMAAKHQALVFYLAGQHSPVARSRLASLLWGRLDPAAARGNLRVALSRLRRVLPEMLDINAVEVGFSASAPVRVDWRELERISQHPAAYPPDLAADIARSWRGPLLDGFELGDADEYDEWIVASRQRAARSAVALRRHLAGICEDDGKPDAAIEHLRAWLDIDETDEQAHMCLMRLLAVGGRRTAAIAQYETCRAVLMDRLGARPSADCYALYCRIHADAPRPGSQTTPAQTAAAVPVALPSNVQDAGPVGLIGRGTQLETLRERLLDPQCRWLTIVGPGGVGKTRIAQAAAGQLRDRFPGGTSWFSGRELPDNRDPTIGRRLAESIALELGGGTGPDAAAPSLLVLDNAETIEGARELVDTLLARLPHATVLATSRVRVGGSREWLLELGGLDLARNSGGDLGSSEAARLFADCIRRADPAFEPKRHAMAVERICSRVAGLPLALEMAAHGARAVGVNAMAERIDAGTGLVDPDRQPDDPHRSLDVVLADSWTLLPENARSAARRLAALPDEFDADLAGAVEVRLDALDTLRKHSWLGRTAGDRLAMHPLQREYLRRGGDWLSLVQQVTGLLAAHLGSRLQNVTTFGDLDPANLSDAPVHTGSALLAVFEPPAIRMATDHAIGSWPAAQLCAYIDNVTAWLVAHDRDAEAAALLARAGRRAALPPWRYSGWSMRRGEILSERGDAVAGAQAWRHALQRLGFGDLEAQVLPSVLPSALGQLRSLRHWPQSDPDRRAFSALVARSLMQFGQHLSFTTRPAPMFACVLLLWLVSARALGRAERTGALSMTAYGNMLVGAPRVSRALARFCERRGVRADDSRLRLGAEEALAARRIADGRWQGLLPMLDGMAGEWQQLRCPRHELECRSLAAKVAFFQGLLDQSDRRFTGLTARARALGARAGGFWGPLGEVETGLILETHDIETLRCMLEESRHAMAEIENVDSAYTLRWFGLRARVAWRSGDLDALRESVMAGAAAGARIPFCGFWAHEGFAGVGEGLIQLRRRERDTGGAVAALTDTWLAFRKPLRAHCRRFTPARALWHYLHALDAAESGRMGEAGRELRASVRCAERQGMRVELARSCAMIGALESDAAWAGRATRLWREMGAAGKGAESPGFVASPAAGEPLACDTVAASGRQFGLWLP